MQQTRVNTREEIGAVQLAGLKLLALAWIWKAAKRLLRAGLNGRPDPGLSGLLGGWHLNVPTLAQAIAAGGKGELFAGGLWVCLAIELIMMTLGWAILGHFAIGALRLFGFRAFRNTYKPPPSPTTPGKVASYAHSRNAARASTTAPWNRGP